MPPSTAATTPSPGVQRALLLAGGGMRVAYQAGAMLALEEAGLNFQLMDGTSGGTINLAMRLSGLSPAEMCARWECLDPKDFASLLTLPEYLTPGGPTAMGGLRGIQDEVFPSLGIDVAKIRAEDSLQATFNVCNFTDKVNVAIPHQEIVGELLLAGVSLPMFTPAVPYGDKTYVDSVWVKDANITEMVKRGAEELWLVWCIGNTPDYNPGLLEQYVHMIEISANAALFSELEWLGELNRRIKNEGKSPFGQTRPIHLHVIKPELALPLDPEFLLGRIDAHSLIANGYSDARTTLSQGDPAKVEWSPAVTRMRAAHQGLLYRETFLGEVVGVFAGQVVLTICLQIPDMHAFLADADEQATIYGSLLLPMESFPCFLYGGSMRRTQSADGQRRVMIKAKVSVHRSEYQLEAWHGLPEAGVDLQQLTRLECRLIAIGEQEPEVSKPGSCSGQLQLKGGLPALIKTLCPLGTQGAKEAASVVMDFARFYGGSAFADHFETEKPWWQFW
jgi:predicted acylesterase/phospholipase RssA